MKTTSTLLALAPLLASALAESTPQNVKDFYNSLEPGSCSGSDVLSSGYHDTDGSDSGEWAYCQQGMAGKGVFIKGNGKFANMDIDCDGNQAGGGAGTRCGASDDTQSETAFKDTVATYGISDLDANIHPYVVFGNVGSYSPTFNPQDHGIQPLSVMAVVCGDNLVYGVWGDENGDDGPPLVGEASLALATACYGDSVNGNAGHDGTDVLYIGFTGDEAVPGKNGADWGASNYDDFAASIKDLGDKLIAGLVGGNGTSTTTSSSAAPTTMMTSTTSSAAPTSTGSCSWAGHCAGASCSSDDDCSDDLTCSSGKCGSA